MKCLYCGKTIIDTASSIELSSYWHLRCVKKFFGTKELPLVDISDSSLKELTIKSVNKGCTVAGVQKKLSLHMSLEDKPRLTMVNYPTGYILKPQVDEYLCLPEAENLIMQMADVTKIRTVPHALINVDGKTAYITKRIDREKSGQQVILAMEDFCQLDQRLTQDKYKGSYERCAKIISKYSSEKGIDIIELFIRLVFSFVVGNSDMHLKNFSLIEKEEASNEYHLSAAYDLLPVNIIIPEDKEEMALTLNGKKNRINRQDFIDFAINIGIEQKVAEKLIDKIVDLEKTYLSMCDSSLLIEDLKEKLKEIIRERTRKLKE